MFGKWCGEQDVLLKMQLGDSSHVLNVPRHTVVLLGMFFPTQASLISWISLRAIRSLWHTVQRQELKASRRVKGK